MSSTRTQRQKTAWTRGARAVPKNRIAAITECIGRRSKREPENASESLAGTNAVNWVGSGRNLAPKTYLRGSKNDSGPRCGPVVGEAAGRGEVPGGEVDMGYSVQSPALGCWRIALLGS